MEIDREDVIQPSPPTATSVIQTDPATKTTSTTPGSQSRSSTNGSLAGVKDYVANLTLNSHGMAVHITDIIRGRLCFFIVQSNVIPDLSVKIYPQRFPQFAFHAKSFHQFAVYPWRIQIYDENGQQYTPQSFAFPHFNDKLVIEVNGGQEGTNVMVVIRYV